MHGIEVLVDFTKGAWLVSYSWAITISSLLKQNATELTVEGINVQSKQSCYPGQCED